MISTTMSPQQFQAAIASSRRTTKQLTGRNRRRRARRRQAPGQVYTSTDLVTQRKNTTTSRNTAGIKVANTELLTSIAGAATSPYVAADDLPLEPRSLVWGRSIANSYSLYKFGKVRLVYKPVIGTTTNASVAFGYFSDPVDGTYWLGNSPTLAALSQARKFVQGPAWTELVLELDPSDYNTDWFYVSNTTPATDADIRVTIAGTFGVFVQSNATVTNSPLGNLYIEYELMLKDPTPFTSNV